MNTRSGIQTSLQPDIKARVTTLVSKIEYLTGTKPEPFQVKNQGNTAVTVTIYNKDGDQVAGVVLNAGEWEPAVIFGIKADAQQTSVNLLIGW